MKFSFKKNPLLVLGLAIFTFLGVVGCSSKEIDEKLAQHENEIQEVTSDVGTLKTQVAALRTSVASVTAELEELAGLRDSLDAVATQVTGLATSLADLQATVAALSGVDDTLGTLQAKVTALETSAAEFQEAFTNLSGSVATKAEKAALDTLSSTVGTLGATVASIQSTYVTKAEALEQLNTLKTGYETAVADLRAEFEEESEEFATALAAVTVAYTAAIAEVAEEFDAHVEASATVHENLEAAIEAISGSIAGDVEEALEELEADLEALDAAYKAADAALDARLTAAETKVATLEEKVAALLTSVGEITERLDTFASANDVAALQTATADLPEIRVALSTVSASFAAAKTALEATDVELAGRLAALESAVTEMGGDISGLKFVNSEDYMKATALLAGTYELSEEELEAWGELKSAIEAVLGEIDFGNDAPYSHGAWKDIAEAFEDHDEYYTDKQVEAFNATEKSQYFFLGRALTTDEVKACFDNFKDYIASLPTLEGNLHEAVTAIEFITVDTITEGKDAHKEWLTLVGLYDLAKVLEDHEDTFEDDEEKYLLLKEAYENLVDAKAWAEEFVTTVNGRAVTETEGEEGLALLSHADEYDTDAEQLADKDLEFFNVTDNTGPLEEPAEEPEATFFDFYPEGYSIATLIPETVEEVKDRVFYALKMKAAKTDFGKDIDPETEGEQHIYGTLPCDVSGTVTYNSDEFNAIKETYEAILAWKEAQEVDTENMVYIYNIVTGSTLAAAKTLYEYADDAETIYQTLIVGTELAAKIAPFHHPESSYNNTNFYNAVDYAEKETYLGYQALFDAIYKAGEFEENAPALVALKATYATNSPAADVNYAAMLAKADIVLADYAAVKTRLVNLDLAKDAIAGQLARIEDFYDEEEEKYVVTFADWNDLFNAEDEDSVRGKLDDIYDAYKITKHPNVGGNGNVAMSEAVETAYLAIGQAYNDMAEEVREAVNDVNDLLTDEVVDYPLEFAVEIEAISQRIAEIISEYHFSDADIVLSYDQTEVEGINFNQLQSRLTTALTGAMSMAVEAQASYLENKPLVNQLMATHEEIIDEEPVQVPDYDPENVKLDQFGAITEAWDELVVWSRGVFPAVDGLWVDDDPLTTEVDESYTPTDEEVRAAIAEHLVKIQPRGEATKFEINMELYDLYKTAEFEKIAALKFAMATVHDAAVAEWTVLSEELTRLGALYVPAGDPEPEEPSWTYTINDKTAFDNAFTALTTFIGKYYANYGAAVHVMEDEDAITAAFTTARTNFNEFYTAAQADFAELVGRIYNPSNHVFPFEAITFTAAGLDDILENHPDDPETIDNEAWDYFVEHSAFGAKQQAIYLAINDLGGFNQQITQFYATYGADEESDWFEHYQIPGGEVNLLFKLKQAKLMSDAVRYAFYYAYEGVDTTRIWSLYNQYIRSYSYNLASTEEQLENYFGIYKSTLEQEPIEVELP